MMLINFGREEFDANIACTEIELQFLLGSKCNISKQYILYTGAA